MSGNFLENEPLLRKFNPKQLRKFAKENKISIDEFCLIGPKIGPIYLYFLAYFWAVKRYDYEKLIEKIAPLVEKDQIIEFAKRKNISLIE